MGSYHLPMFLLVDCGLKCKLVNLSQSCTTKGKHGVSSTDALYLWGSHSSRLWTSLRARRKFWTCSWERTHFFFSFQKAWPRILGSSHKLPEFPPLTPPALPHYRSLNMGRLPLPGLDQALIDFKGDELDISGNQEKKTSQRSFMIQ